MRSTISAAASPNASGRACRSIGAARARASRLTLELTGVHVERLMDISEEDAIAEGLACEPDDLSVRFGPEPGKMTNRTPKAAFARVWNEINAKRGFPWDSNPFVWALTFRVLSPDDTDRR